MTEVLNNFLRSLSEILSNPVKIVLILLIIAALVLVGNLLAEFFTEKRHLNLNLPALADEIKAAGEDVSEIEDSIWDSPIPRRQRQALSELLHHPKLNNTMREALAQDMLEREKSRFERKIKISDTVAKLGPIFGLLGTLIPLGPGIVALGQGDALTLSTAMLTAFDTTIAGLLAAAIAMIVSTVRRSWYSRIMSEFEALVICVLEAVADD